MLTALLDAVAADLGFLARPPMFFGAAVLPLYIDRTDMFDGGFRPTEDVDVVVSLAVGTERQGTVPEMEASLRRHGFTDDLRAGRRNMHAFVSPSGIPVDIVIDALVADTDWALRSRESARAVVLETGRQIRIPTAAYYLACKIAASRNRERWEGDYYCHDLEDIALLLCGRTGLAEECRHAENVLAGYLGGWALEVTARSTGYGSDAHSVLMSNVPEAGSIIELEGILEAIAGRAVGPGLP